MGRIRDNLDRTPVRNMIENSMKENGISCAVLAERIGISRAALYRRLKRLDETKSKLILYKNMAWFKAMMVDFSK